MSYVAKIIMCGNSMVGKTSLLARYSEDIFKEKYNQTVGANFLVKEINLAQIADQIEFKDPQFREDLLNKGFKIYFWDIGGQKHTLFVTGYYFEDASGAMLVFNLNDRESFEQLDFWVEKIHEKRGDIPYIIVGNKIDLLEGDDPEISDREIEQKCDELGVEWMKTSAKSSKNVEPAFNLLFQEIILSL